MKILDKLTEVLFEQYGILGLLLLLFAFFIYHLVTKLLRDKEEQIKNLAEENREYRERFTQLIDTQFEQKEKK